MANNASRPSLAETSRYFLAGVFTLFVSNLLGSTVIAFAHSIAFLYHRGPPDAATQDVLATVMRQVSAIAPLTNWMIVLCGAALLSYRSKARSWGYFLVYVVGSWLSVLPLTLMPEHPEMHGVAPQFGRFSITAVFTFFGVVLGTRLWAQAERKTDKAWAIRTAGSPQALVDALSQFEAPRKVRFALFPILSEQERSLGPCADSATNPSPLDPRLCSDFIDWPRLLRDESLVRHGSGSLHPSLPRRTWWYFLRHETRESALLLVAPQRMLLPFGSRNRYQRSLDLARLSLQQQELVHAAQQNARDGERKLVSYEIHDRLAQDLISGLMQLDAARTYLGSVKADGERALEGVEGTLRRALEDIRQMAWGLYQTPKGGATLRARLEGVIEEFREHRQEEVDFRVVGDESSVSGLEALAAHGALATQESASPTHDAILVAGLREALSNIKKHAMARNVQVTLSHINGSVALDVSDNGRGMRKSPLRAVIGHGGFGLHALRRRVEHAGGRLVLEEGQVGGTTLSIQFPAGALRS